MTDIIEWDSIIYHKAVLIKDICLNRDEEPGAESFYQDLLSLVSAEPWEDNVSLIPNYN
jgi:hypothetical protein